jgi:hypothetical protein
MKSEMLKFYARSFYGNFTSPPAKFNFDIVSASDGYTFQLSGYVLP